MELTLGAEHSWPADPFMDRGAGKMKSLDFSSRALCRCLVAVTLVGCGGSQPPIGAPGAMLQTSAIAPLQLPGQRYMRGKGTWQMFTSEGYLAGIVRARNGDFWAADGDQTTSLSRFTPKGKLRVFQIGYTPLEMTLDGSGNFWLTVAEYEDQIISVTPSLKVTAFSLTDSADGGIALGQDGNIWFVEATHIGKLTPNGKLTEYATGLTQGESGLTWADGLVWFHGNGLTSLDPKNGHVTSYDVPMGSSGGAIVAAPDGSLWYAMGSLLGRFDLKTKKATTYKGPDDFIAYGAPEDTALTPTGSVWYTCQRLGGHEKIVKGGGFVRFDIRAKRFTAYASPKGYDWGWDLSIAPDGKIWGTAGRAVVVLDANP
jgi:streptogramin lyase